jgi:hypothetical protein
MSLSVVESRFRVHTQRSHHCTKGAQRCERLLKRRKVRKPGKRVTLNGELVFSRATQEVPGLVEEAEAETAKK